MVINPHYSRFAARQHIHFGDAVAIRRPAAAKPHELARIHAHLGIVQAICM
jgi:hypothetical protein